MEPNECSARCPTWSTNELLPGAVLVSPPEESPAAEARDGPVVRVVGLVGRGLLWADGADPLVLHLRDVGVDEVGLSHHPGSVILSAIRWTDRFLTPGQIEQFQLNYIPFFPAYKRPLCLRGLYNFRLKLGKEVTALQYIPVLPCTRDPLFLKVSYAQENTVYWQQIRPSKIEPKNKFQNKNRERINQK